MKNQYPIRGGQNVNDSNLTPPDKGGISANDISAFGDESIIDPISNPQLLNQQNQDISYNAGEGDDYGEDVLGGQKTRFKDEEDKRDLLEGIRNQKKSALPAKALHAKKKAADKLQTPDGEEGPTAETPGETDGGETPGGPTADEKAEDEKFLEEDTGSVASSTKSLAKHLRMLRNALYENYLPQSINNLKINAKIVFAALLILTIVWYVYSKNIYMQLKDNIENIHSSKNRMNSLTDIGANTRILASMT
jgi:hypothetical protein